MWIKFDRWITTASRRSLLAKREELSRLPGSMPNFGPYSDVQRMIAQIDERLVESSLGKEATIITMIKPHMDLILRARREGLSWPKVAAVLHEVGVCIHPGSLYNAIRTLPQWKQCNRPDPTGAILPHYKEVLKLRLMGKPWQDIATFLRARMGIRITGFVLSDVTMAITDRLQMGSANAAPMTAHQPPATQGRSASKTKRPATTTRAKSTSGRTSKVKPKTRAR
jgi:hypothetical protein